MITFGEVIILTFGSVTAIQFTNPIIRFRLKVLGNGWVWRGLLVVIVLTIMGSFISNAFFSDAQIDSLKQVGCERVFADKISGTTKERPGWNDLMDYIRNGDMLVISELSRMSRSLSHLLEIVDDLKKRQVDLKSLRENIDTSTATGRAFLSIMGAISQMELEIKSERAEAGRIAAKARGKSGGRPRTDPDKLEQARILYQNSDKSAHKACELFGFSRRILFSYMKMTQNPLT